MNVIHSVDPVVLEVKRVEGIQGVVMEDKVVVGNTSVHIHGQQDNRHVQVSKVPELLVLGMNRDDALVVSTD